MKNVYGHLHQQTSELGSQEVEKKKSLRRKVTYISLAIGLPIASFFTYNLYKRNIAPREITADERVLEEKKELGSFYSSGLLYGQGKQMNGGRDNLASLLQESSESTKDILGLIDQNASVTAYHLIGRIKEDKVVPYYHEGKQEYSQTVRSFTRNPDEVRQDLKNGLVENRPQIVCAIGSLREQFNKLPDGKVDPNSLFGILDEFSEKYPEYSQKKLRAIFFHTPREISLFGQQEYETDKIKAITNKGWVNAFLGISLGKDEFSRAIFSDGGLVGYWKDGPGISNFSPKDVKLDKKFMEDRFKMALGERWHNYVQPWFFYPWGVLPKDEETKRELAHAYQLLFLGQTSFDAQAVNGKTVTVRVAVSK